MYGKLINNKLETAPINKGNILNYNLNIEAMTQDGYKEVIEATKPEYPFILTYEETENNIVEIITPDIETAKQDKIFENDTARDITLNQGVLYNNILFDSDTDQKANILGAVLQMSDTDTIPWFGMNNDCLVCTKQDLLNIGGLITTLHSFVWNKNAEIKTAINEAQTIEEINNIEIDYEIGG